MRISLLIVLVAAPFLIAEAHVLAKATNRVKNVFDVALGQPIDAILIRPIKSIFGLNKNKVAAPAPAVPTHEISNDIDEHDEPTPEISNDIDEHEEQHEEEHEEGGHHFGYDEHHGAETWADSFPECGGQSQSPINIVESETTLASPNQYPILEFLNYWEKPDKMDIINNGHALQISGTWATDKWPALTGGPLGTNKYQYAQSHIHWGVDEKSGSEHLVDGQAFPLEMHSVHWNVAYGTFNEAMKHKNGLAVLGHFGLTQTDESPMWELFLKYARSVEGSSAAEQEIEPVPINTLNLDNAKDNYVTYQGSLTTPPCSEVVTWLISQEPLYFSREQMEVMRSTVKNSDGEDFHNFRPPQPLYGRPVTAVKKNNIA